MSESPETTDSVEVAAKPYRNGKPGQTRVPAAKPTKLTSLVVKQICRLVVKGAPYTIAAEATGVHPATLSRWNARGCEDIEAGRENTPYAKFARRLYLARGKAVMRRLKRIDQAAIGGAVIKEKSGVDRNGEPYFEKQVAPPDWRADAFVLERTRPEFAKQSRVEHSGTVRRESIDVTLSGTVEESQLLGLRRLLESAVPAEISQDAGASSP